MSNRGCRTPPESSSMTEENVKMSGRLKPMLGKDALKSSATEVRGNVTSPRSSLKSTKDQDKQGETGRMSSKRKRIKESNPIKYGKNLVGSKVKVWWPDDEMFYEGVIESFDYVKKKHTVCYTDGEKEELNLRRERWEFVGDYLVLDGDADAVVEHSTPDTSSDAQRKRQRKKKKERNTNSESSKRRKRSKFQMDDCAFHSSIKPLILGLEFLVGDSRKESAGMSKDDGKPESEIKVNNTEPRELGDKSQGDSGKASGGIISKDDSAKTQSHPTKQDRQRSSPMSKGKTPQIGNTLTIASSSSKVMESGKALSKTSSSSKGGEGNNSVWPIEGTLHHQPTLRVHFSRMLIEGIHSDVTIITSDGSLKAHKSILSARSPVFHSMFEGEKVSSVETKEMTSESCMALLSFMYGSLSQEGFLRYRLDLLGAANKYEIVDLKDACEKSLLEDINPGNVLERLQKAWLYKLDKLKKGCSTYLLDSGKIYDVREEMNEFFIQAEEGMLVEMFQEVLGVWKRS